MVCAYDLFGSCKQPNCPDLHLSALKRESLADVARKLVGQAKLMRDSQAASELQACARKALAATDDKQREALVRQNRVSSHI